MSTRAYAEIRRMIVRLVLAPGEVIRDDRLQAELGLGRTPIREALQRLSRRPPVLSLLYPGSLQDAVYLRGALETMLPEVERRTVSLRADLERGRALQRQAEAANRELRQSQGDLGRRRARTSR